MPRVQPSTFVPGAVCKSRKWRAFIRTAKPPKRLPGESETSHERNRRRARLVMVGDDR